MKYANLIAIGALALAILDWRPVVAETTAQGATVLEMVIASVDGEPLTTSDLRQFVASHAPGQSLEVTGGDMEVRKYLRELILERLLEKEAQSMGIAVSDADIDAYMREVQQQNGVDEERFRSLLAEQGMSLERYKSEVRQEIIRARVISSRVRQKVNVLEEEIESFLREHPERLPGHGHVRVEQVFLKFPEDEPQAKELLRERALELRAKASEGGSLQELAGEAYTDLGFIDRNDLKAELRQAAGRLNIGETSEVIHTDSGLYLLRIAEESGVTVPQAVRDEVRRELFETKLATALERFFNNDLPAKYSVEIKL